MRNETRLVLAVLAVYRLARLIAIDDGPLDVFKLARNAIGKRAHRGAIQKSLADLMNCPYCIGVWLAGIAALFMCRSWREWILLSLSIAGGQAALQSLSYEESE